MLWFAHIVVSEVGGPADFASCAVKHLTQLKSCEPWKGVRPDLDYLQRRAEEGASWIYGGLFMLGAKSAQRILDSGK